MQAFNRAIVDFRRRTTHKTAMLDHNPSRTYIIAEAGVNHDGSEERARELIAIAKRAGADAVKFQLFDPSALSTADAPLADYQSQNLGDTKTSQRAMLEALALPPETFVRIAQYCADEAIDFLCTPFDEASLAFLLEHTAMPALKLPSGELTNALLLTAAANSGLPLILSTGMANLEEIQAALALLTPLMGSRASEITLLHCVSTYPAPVASTHLRAIDTMQRTFALPVGLSDHTLGINVAIAAVARGATIIEKHFTYSPTAHGPDHAASLAPEALHGMIQAIREVEIALGLPEKRCQPEEESTRHVARKSLVAAQPISRGELFTPENLTAKRPAPSASISPMQYAGLLGKPAQKDYNADQHIDPCELLA